MSEEIFFTLTLPGRTSKSIQYRKYDDIIHKPFKLVLKPPNPIRSTVASRRAVKSFSHFVHSRSGIELCGHQGADGGFLGAVINNVIRVKLTAGVEFKPKEQ